MGPISMTMRVPGTHAVGGNHGFGEETVTLVHQHATGVAQVVGQLLGVFELLERFNAQKRLCRMQDTEGSTLVDHGQALHAADDGLHERRWGARASCGAVPADQQFGVQVGAEDALDRGCDLVVEDEKLLIGNMMPRVLLKRVRRAGLGAFAGVVVAEEPSRY